MVSQISDVGLNVLSPLPGQSVPKPVPSGQATVQSGVSAGVSDTATFGETVPGRYAELLGAQDAKGAQASGARDLNGQMSSLGGQLAKLKTAIEGIVKMYPPYPPGNPTRMALVNEISGLRKQIESLVYPPETGQGESAVSRSLPGVGLDLAAIAGKVPGASADQPGGQPTDQQLSSLLGNTEKVLGQLPDGKDGMWSDVVQATSSQDVEGALKNSDQVAAGLAGQQSLSIGLTDKKLGAIL